MTTATLDDLSQKIDDLDESVRILSDGLRMMLPVLGHHGELLSQILAAAAEQARRMDRIEQSLAALAVV